MNEEYVPGIIDGDFTDALLSIEEHRMKYMREDTETRLEPVTDKYRKVNVNAALNAALHGKSPHATKRNMDKAHRKLKPQSAPIKSEQNRVGLYAEELNEARLKNTAAAFAYENAYTL
ncbi:MAG: hypothetical protein FWG18_01460 [Alphaproteobacteria bacterium]|nr:hypothetical protein [Alphaproteobacteria bacterium]